MSKTHMTRRDARRAARSRRRLITRSLTVGIIIVVLIAVILLVIESIKSQMGAVTSAMQTSASLQTQGGPTPDLVGTKQYSSAPPMLIDVTKQYFATVKMVNGGEFMIQLYPVKAPITVNSFVFLARQGYFDGVTFHRVLEGFMAQGGDPTGTGNGGPGYSFVTKPMI